MALASYADTHYVDVHGTNPVPPHTNWATAANVIQEAIDAAAPGDTVLVTNGVYSVGGRIVQGVVRNRVAIDKPLHLLSVNGPDVTIITGEYPGVRCVYLADGACLSGFTLTNGSTLYTEGQGDPLRDESGGGVWCESTNALVKNSIIVAGWAPHAGGGAYLGTLTNCSLIGNIAFIYGGGAYGGVLIDCRLTRNYGWDFGGGAYGATLYDCTLTGNDADPSGGGAENCTLHQCVLSNNWAVDVGGGASWSTLNECTLAGNVAELFRGGGAYGSTLWNCVLSNNWATESGGGADWSTLVNCAVVGNETWGADEWGGGGGGGVSDSLLQNCLVSSNRTDGSVGGAHGTLINCTVVGNHASGSVGGASGNLTNCIVYYNTASHPPNVATDSAMAYTCTPPLPSGGVGNITNSPLFVNTNRWSDLRLQSNSPCINAGNNDFVRTATDLDGMPRIRGGVVDMGCYEFFFNHPPTAAQPVLLHTWSDQSAAVSFGKLMAPFHDPDGDPFSVSLVDPVGVAGGTVAATNASAVYSPASGFIGEDSVGYVITDVHGASGAGILLVGVDATPDVPPNAIRLTVDAGQATLCLAGIPGVTYEIEASTNMVDWTSLGGQTAGPAGILELVDEHAGLYSVRYYRARVP